MAGSVRLTLRMSPTFAAPNHEWASLEARASEARRTGGLLMPMTVALRWEGSCWFPCCWILAAGSAGTGGMSSVEP